MNSLNTKRCSFMLLISVITILFSVSISIGQIFDLPSKNSAGKNIQVRSDIPSELKNDNSPLCRYQSVILTEKEKLIQSQIEHLKQPGYSKPEGENILRLQKELEKSGGSTVTRQEANDIGHIIPASNFRTEEMDNLSFSYIMYGGGNYVAALAAQVEQTGATAGKIWVAVGLANGDTGLFALPDTIAIFNSVNNGMTYDLYAKIAFSGHNKIEFDKMDMELIENTTGQKYLHIVFSYITNGGYGQSLIGYTVVSAPALGYAGFTLFPPGYNANSTYTAARITSDNTRYPSNSWITVAVTQDSLSGPDHYFMTKMCRVLNPYTTSPAVTYIPKSIYSVAPGHNYDVFTDVANYHNGNDTLIFVLSAYPGYESILYFYKAYSNSLANPYPTSGGYLIPSGNNAEYARIASTGGTDQNDLMITYSDNYLNSGDFDQFVLYSQDASGWMGYSLDYTSYNNSKYGDIIGRRNTTGSYSISFKNIYGNLQNVSFYSFSDLYPVSQMHASNTDYANTLASPKPLFKYENNDSCLNIWSYFYSVSSTGGCSATNLYVRAALEGYYDENTDEQSNYAPMYILLAQSSPPYNIVDTGFAFMDVQGMSNVFTFPKAPSGNYYLIAKHFNCMETWSAAPVYVNPYSYSFYDFTTSGAEAYGNNMVQKGSRWCLYSGDVNQDGIIDLNDVVSISNDASEFVAVKYAVTDLNGDSFTDLNDLLLGFNNSILFISKITPP